MTLDPLSKFDCGSADGSAAGRPLRELLAAYGRGETLSAVENVRITRALQDRDFLRTASATSPEGLAAAAEKQKAEAERVEAQRARAAAARAAAAEKEALAMPSEANAMNWSAEEVKNFLANGGRS